MKAMSLFLVLLLVLSAVSVYAQEDVTENEVTETAEGVTEEPTAEPAGELPDAGVTPDQPFLYGLERAMERITLALMFNKAAKAKRGLSYALERKQEVAQMIAEKNLAAAEKGMKAHNQNMIMVNALIESITDGPETELEISEDLESDINAQEAQVVRIKAKVKGVELNEEQQKAFEEIIKSIEESNVDVKIKIKAKVEKSKIRVKALKQAKEEKQGKGKETPSTAAPQITGGAVEVPTKPEEAPKVTTQSEEPEEVVACPQGTKPRYVEKLAVKSDGSVTTSSSVLDSGVKYILRASGTYVYWEAQLPDAGIADAKYSLRPEGSYNPGPGPQWISGDDLPDPYTHYLEVLVDEEAVAWGGFNEDHIYRILLDGEDSAVNFNIVDSSYGDNSGEIEVQIYKCVKEEEIEPAECPSDTTPKHVETITVQSDGSTASSSELKSGETYLAKASGTYTYWPSKLPDAGIADAKYSLRPDGSYNPGPRAQWISGDDLPSPYTNMLELWVDGASVAWGSFNAEHEYTIALDGENSAVDFNIESNNYNHYSGELTVDIYECVAGEEPETVECPEGTNPEYTETVTVPSNGNVVSSDVLEEDTKYLFEASGTYTYNPQKHWADAEWYLKEGKIVKGDTEGSKPYVLDISINGYNINRDWGAYNPEHKYRLLFEGEGEEADFSIYDSNSGDNLGSLKLDIYQCVEEEQEPEDSDGDGVTDDKDECPDTEADEPSGGLGTNRWIWNGKEWITNKPKGKGPNKSFTMEQTRGCSCFQILEKSPGEKKGHYKFGCSSGVIESFING